MSFWSRIAGRKDSGEPSRNGSTAETQTGIKIPGVNDGEALEVTASLQTDPGCVRDSNEDSVMFTRPQDTETLAAKGLLALVADGMGGCSGGEIASYMVVNTVPRLYYDSKAEPSEALRTALEKVNGEIYAEAADKPELAGMGTTAVALAICGDRAYAAYVGDSRLYLLRAGRIYQMTEDHSVVYEMVRKGLLTAEEARNHEDRNVLSRSLGGRPEVEVGFWEAPLSLRNEDRLLICSDGLHDLVTDAEILSTVMTEQEGSAAAKLIAIAKERGGYDNVTVALIHVHGNKAVPDSNVKATREIQVQP
jgi:serine/threonine protein phosphatase PrpC